eukprot:TCONS_00019460-protein
MMRELHVHMLNYFYQELSSPPFASSTLSHEYNNFTNIPGAVKVSLYEGFIGNLDTLHAQTPSRIGRYDNFESFNFDRLLENYGMILQTYFVPPSDGLYRFILVSDDDAKLFISLNDQESDKFEIVHNLIAIGTTDYSRQSSAIQLQANQKYYMEIIGREIHYIILSQVLFSRTEIKLYRLPISTWSIIIDLTKKYHGKLSHKINIFNIFNTLFIRKKGPKFWKIF